MTSESTEQESDPILDLAQTDRRETKGSTNRRQRSDRRKRAVPVALDRRKGDRRLGERRRQIDPTTCERDYDPDELEFMQAIEAYKREFRRPFPTWSEVLEVAKSLGYRKVAERNTIVVNRAKANLYSAPKSEEPNDRNDLS